MSKRIGILVIFSCLLAAGIRAQLRVNAPAPSLPIAPFQPTFRPFLLASTMDTAPFVSPIQPSGPTLPKIYRYDDLALFCRIEVQLEKVTRIPVRFRLGSVDYVDYLEGKRDDP